MAVRPSTRQMPDDSGNELYAPGPNVNCDECGSPRPGRRLAASRWPSWQWSMTPPPGPATQPTSSPLPARTPAARPARGPQATVKWLTATVTATSLRSSPLGPTKRNAATPATSAPRSPSPGQPADRGDPGRSRPSARHHSRHLQLRPCPRIPAEGRLVILRARRPRCENEPPPKPSRSSRQSGEPKTAAVPPAGNPSCPPATSRAPHRNGSSGSPRHGRCCANSTSPCRQADRTGRSGGSSTRPATGSSPQPRQDTSMTQIAGPPPTGLA